MPREFDTDAERKAYDLGREDERQAAEDEQPEKLTIPRIQKMTTEEVAARIDEVNAVLAEG